MCKRGDIILIDGYEHQGQSVNKHSFVVLNDEHGTIQGMDYDFVCNVMSSFKNDEQRRRKLSYQGNFEILDSDKKLINGNNLNGFIKAEQFYYFDKSKTDYIVIGNVTIDFFNSLVSFINELQVPVEHIVDNLYT